MTKVNAIQQNDNSILSNVVKGSSIGAVTGYVSKYMLPVTAPEKADKKYQAALGIIKRETNNMKGLVIEEIRNLPHKTLAQDTFIKMVDVDVAEVPETVKNVAGKDVKTDVSMFKASKKLSLLKGLAPEDKLELRNIVSSVNDYASKMYRRHLTAYQVGVTKRIRPGFVGLGAFLGFASAVVYNVMQTDVHNV